MSIKVTKVYIPFILQNAENLTVAQPEDSLASPVGLQWKHQEPICKICSQDLVEEERRSEVEFISSNSSRTWTHTHSHTHSARALFVVIIISTAFT